jgi:hypothetical protein
MAAATITFEGAGPVPALPAELRPVALAARDLTARTWGVVIWPDDEPTLVAGGQASSVAAARLADVLADTYGHAVFVVYRCPTAVTVHTRDVGHPRNTLGTLDVPGQPGARRLRTVADLIAHIHQIGDPDALRAYAEQEHRRERQHVRH